MFGGKKETFKPVRVHAPGSKREQYSNFTLKTLGSGDITGNISIKTCQVTIQVQSLRCFYTIL